MNGQMNRGGHIGDTLHELSRLPEVDSCLEVGTWNGQGSTYCIASGLAGTGGNLTTVEVDPERYLEATEFYQDMRLPVHLVNGLTLWPESYHPYEHYLPLIEGTFYESVAPGTHRSWYDAELELARNASHTGVLSDAVRHRAPFQLVLLDGGEYMSSEEFGFLEPFMDGYLVLDDTNPKMSIKNALNRQRVLESPLWEVLIDEQDERCGWMVAKKRRT